MLYFFGSYPTASLNCSFLTQNTIASPKDSLSCSLLIPLHPVFAFWL